MIQFSVCCDWGRSWVQPYQSRPIRPAKLLQQPASNFRSLQDPASGFQDSRIFSLQRSPRRRFTISPKNRSGLVTSGCAASSIRHRASSCGYSAQIRAGAFSNISCADAKSRGGLKCGALVRLPRHTTPPANSFHSHWNRAPMVREKRWRHLCKIEALTEQNGTCKYCKSPLIIRDATADHCWPRSKKGPTTRDNIVAACRPCNQAKGSTPHVEFYKLIDRKFPKGAAPAILMIWASRRIMRRAHRASERILKLSK